MPDQRSVTATYRLQLRNGVGFADAVKLAPYLADLGVSHLYLSPIEQARAGSTHGYDVTDHTEIEASLGGRAGLERLSDALQARGLKILLDIVPNHMAASTENPWWADVLLRGRKSRYADFFDIDWDAFDGRVLLPVLGAPYAQVLEAGELSIARRRGAMVAAYYDHEFPLRGRPAATGDPASVDAVLSRQAYQLAWWRTAREQINYRRFFDITDLVCMRVERPEVFDAVHGLVVGLVRDGIVDALRVDHVDGLADPEQYLRRLRARVGSAPVFVEKILGPHESLRKTWRTRGTSGYEFAVALDDALIDPAGWAVLRAGTARPFEQVAAESKSAAVRELFASDVDRLTQSIVSLARIDARGRDLSAASIRRAVLGMSAALPVYRTYVTRRGVVTDEDRKLVRDAAAHARSASPDDAAAIGFVAAVLLLDVQPRAACVQVALRWQQLTGPVAAKGVEDTAMYRYPVLWSRNEVGGEPDAEPGVGALHQLNDWRVGVMPGLSLTTSHDTKRSEDVRWRLYVLSQVPERWERFVRLADRRASELAPEVDDPAVRSLLYTSMLGTWPERIDRAYTARIEAYMTKALREGKVHTRWTDPDESYEGRVTALVRGLLADEGFVRDATRLAAVLQLHGAAHGLGGLVLKAAAPGAPDVYQGQEVWNPSLVDPDNRREVDFAGLASQLRTLADADPASILRTWKDGRIKQHIVRATLQARAAAPDLFAHGRYAALRANGPAAEHVIAFARRRGRDWAVAIGLRLTVGLAGPTRFPAGRDFGTTTLRLPTGAPAEWTDALTGRTVEGPGRGLHLADALAVLPAALLVSSPATPVNEPVPPARP